MTAILGHNFIGGARSAAGTLFLQSLDAASGEALPYRFVQATPEEVDAAAEAAASAYPHYRQLPASRRAEFLDTIAAELDAHLLERIARFKRPKRYEFVDELPKTRSGKIMRRLLKDVAENREVGDVTTLADSTVMNLIQAGLKKD